MYADKDLKTDSTTLSVPKDVEEKLVTFICRNFMVEPGEFSLEESLVDQGVIDSFGLVETAAFMEREFSIRVAQEDMNRVNFGSVKKMAAFIERGAGR